MAPVRFVICVAVADAAAVAVPVAVTAAAVAVFDAVLAGRWRRWPFRVG